MNRKWGVLLKEETPLNFFWVITLINTANCYWGGRVNFGLKGDQLKLKLLGCWK